MSTRRQDKLVGSLLSLPTFTAEDHSLRLDRQRIHLDWDQSIFDEAATAVGAA